MKETLEQRQERRRMENVLWTQREKALTGIARMIVEKHGGENEAGELVWLLVNGGWNKIENKELVEDYEPHHKQLWVAYDEALEALYP
jgi:hypothetical protein